MTSGNKCHNLFFKSRSKIFATNMFKTGGGGHVGPETLTCELCSLGPHDSQQKNTCRIWMILARREKLSVKLIDKYKDNDKDINIMAWIDKEIKSLDTAFKILLSLL